jgi:hypothetical protein
VFRGERQQVFRDAEAAAKFEFPYQLPAHANLTMKTLRGFLTSFLSARKAADLGAPECAVSARSKGTVRVGTACDVFVKHEHVVGRDYSSPRCHSFRALGCTFERCGFRNLDLGDAVLASGQEQTTYIECSFDGTKFRHIVLGQARFERCSFRNVDISRMFAHAAEFVDCDFSGVMRASVFFGRVVGNHRDYLSREINEIRGNDFSTMRFIDVGFREGVDLSVQRLPIGNNYLYLRNAARSLGALRLKYLHSPQSTHREAVFRFLRLPMEEVRNGQASLFLCKDSEQSLSANEVFDTIWEELRRSNG